jgi:Bacterial type II and III secretion system protein
VKRHFAIVALLLMALVTPGRAQEQKPPTTPGAVAPVAVRVQVVLSRYQGEKKISSLPYTLTVNMDDRNRNSGQASLRLGTQVPITTMSRSGSDSNAPLVPSVQYRDVGTSIDCIATSLDDGRFKLQLIVEDSSVETGPGSGSNTTHPAFRSFRTSDTVLLRDGQSAEYSTATDRVSGDVWKVNVALNVVK